MSQPPNARKRPRDVASTGQTMLGAWTAIPDPLVAEVLAAQGYDYVCVDRQHGLAGYETLVNAFRAVEARGKVGLVRLAWNDPAEIMRALDAGARGVVVPMVESAEQAAAAVAACRFPPGGIRSYGPTRARLSLGTGEPAQLDQLWCFVQVETRAGLAALAAIAATPGLDGIYIGPYDLGLDLGVNPSRTPDVHGEIAEAIETIRAECRRRDLAIGIHCLTGAVARRYVEQDFDLVTVIVDANLLARAAAAELADARAGSGKGGAKR